MLSMESSSCLRSLRPPESQLAQRESITFQQTAKLHCSGRSPGRVGRSWASPPGSAAASPGHARPLQPRSSMAQWLRDVQVLSYPHVKPPALGTVFSILALLKNYFLLHDFVVTGIPPSTSHSSLSILPAIQTVFPYVITIIQHSGKPILFKCIMTL